MDGIFEKTSVKYLISEMEFLNNQISILHKYSSNDFMSLTSNLRGLHKHYSSILNDVKLIQQSLVNENNVNILSQIEQKNIQTKNEFEEFKLKLVSKYKFLLAFKTNFREIVGFVDKAFLELSKIQEYSNISSDDNTFKQLQSGFKCEEEWMNEKFSQLIEVFSYLDGIFDKIPDNDSLILLEDQLKKISNLIAIITNKFSHLVNVKEFQDLAQFGIDEINSMIFDLQFHDIIRQKLEHLMETHKDVQKDLTFVDVVSEHKNIIAQRTNYLPIIPEIADLHKSQLYQINTDYQLAVDNLKDKLQKQFEEVRKHIKSANNLVAEFQTDYIKQVEGLFSKIKVINFNESIISEDSILECKNAFSLLIDDLKIAGKIFSSYAITGQTPSVEEFNVLLSGISTKTKSVILFISNIKTFADDLVFVKDNNLNDSNSFFNFHKNFIEDFVFFDRNTSHLAEISNNFNGLNSSLLNLIAIMQHPNLFENVVGDMLLKLEEINEKGVLINKVSIEEKKVKLNDIQNRYTMDSERVVHQRILVSNEDELVNHNMTQDVVLESDSDFEDDLELF